MLVSAGIVLYPLVPVYGVETHFFCVWDNELKDARTKPWNPEAMEWWSTKVFFFFKGDGGEGKSVFGIHCKSEFMFYAFGINLYKSRTGMFRSSHDNLWSGISVIWGDIEKQSETCSDGHIQAGVVSQKEIISHHISSLYRLWTCLVQGIFILKRNTCGACCQKLLCMNEMKWNSHLELPQAVSFWLDVWNRRSSGVRLVGRRKKRAACWD